MRTIAAIIAATLIALFGATAASAAPVNTPGSSQIETTPVALPPGDTIEVRSGIGAAAGVILGGLAGLPFFVIGALRQGGKWSVRIPRHPTGRPLLRKPRPVQNKIRLTQGRVVGVPLRLGAWVGVSELSACTKRMPEPSPSTR